jgi:chromosome segregation ATPase
LKNDLQVATQELSLVQGKLDQSTEIVAQLQTRLNNLDSQLQDANENFVRVSTQLGNTEADLRKKTADFDLRTEIMEEYVQTISNQGRKLERKRNRIEELRQQINMATSQFAGPGNEETTRASTEMSLSDLQVRIADLETQVQSGENTIQQMKSDIYELRSELEEKSVALSKAYEEAARVEARSNAKRKRSMAGGFEGTAAPVDAETAKRLRLENISRARQEGSVALD